MLRHKIPFDFFLCMLFFFYLFFVIVWIVASFASMSHPIGAFVGWLLSDAIGRRKSLLLASIPFIIGWSMLGHSNSLLMINIAFTVMGLGFGLKEASSLVYTGEIWYEAVDLNTFNMCIIFIQFHFVLKVKHQSVAS